MLNSGEVLSDSSAPVGTPIQPTRLDTAALYSGVVQHGAQLGRTIGFPTANIELKGRRPAVGIYAARIKLQDGRRFIGVAYYGERPTVDGVGELLEVHLFDFSEDLYGMNLAVELVSFIRPDVNFASVDDMTRQIALDCKSARDALSAD